MSSTAVGRKKRLVHHAISRGLPAASRITTKIRLGALTSGSGCPGAATFWWPATVSHLPCQTPASVRALEPTGTTKFCSRQTWRSGQFKECVQELLSYHRLHSPVSSKQGSCFKQGGSDFTQGRSQVSAYYRVSTDRQGKSGLRFEAQQSEVRTFINGNSDLVAEFTEVESGKSDSRPQLERAAGGLSQS